MAWPWPLPRPLPPALGPLQSLSQVVAPGGSLVLSTLSRTPASFLAAIVGAEYLTPASCEWVSANGGTMEVQLSWQYHGN